MGGCLRALEWPWNWTEEARGALPHFQALLPCRGLDRTLQILLQTAEVNRRGRKEVRWIPWGSSQLAQSGCDLGVVCHPAASTG